MPDSESKSLVLFDGVCGLCNRLNQFLLKRDRHDRLRFASLQSDFATSLLQRHGAGTVDLDTVYVVLDHGQPAERLLTRSDAILHVVEQLGGVWRVCRLARWLPKALRDAVYNLVARNRYRVFGKHETCLLPDPGYRNKFLDLA